MEDTEYCIWHADSDEVSKSIEELKQACAPQRIRNQTSTFVELRDGAQLAGLKIGDEVSFVGVASRDSDLSNTYLRHADFSDANLSNADFSDANLSNADLSHTFLSEANFTKANLFEADLTDAILRDADLTDTTLRSAVLTKAELDNATLTGATLMEADATSAYLGGADFTEANLQEIDLTDSHPRFADFKDTYFGDADLINADFTGSDFTDADFWNADLSDAYLQDCNLTGAKLEHAVLVRTNLFGANLTDSRPHGATFTDVQINDDTVVRSEEQRETDGRWWQKGPFLPPQRCSYDPAVGDDENATKTGQIGKAADTYQSFETLARDNARPSLQSEMFVLRQDMQRKRHWYNDEYFEWSFARLSRAVFTYGESLGRIFMVGVCLIGAYALLYAQFDLIRDADGQYLVSLVDALYFSTLTFTTLGLGDFQPEPASQVARLLVTSQAALGAILIAIFVFVLGRRAAR